MTFFLRPDGGAVGVRRGGGARSFAALCFSLCTLAGGALVGSAFSAHAKDPVRPMYTDRPDTTESPYTVPRGMWQIEASFADFSRDSRGISGHKQQWVFGQNNIKLGTTQNSDLQFIFNSHATAGQVEGGDRTFSRGFGDVIVRFKQNLWGNDSGDSAFALMPYLSIPTHTGMSERAWAGGMIVPLAIKLTEPLTLGVMSEFDFRERSSEDAGRFQWLQTASLGVNWTERIGSYHEFVTIVSAGQAFQFSFNSGITFQVRPGLVWDVGTRLGINRAAPDVGAFSGFSVRF